MINNIIDFCIKNRFIVILITLLLTFFGIWSLYKTPLDAIPDLSDNQVIVYTEWMGRGPKIIEDQITYPLSSNLQGLPKVKDVRATSYFGFSMIYIIFEDNVDIYWARTRVLERLNSVRNLLPEEVTPVLGPDGTGVGHIYWYTVKGKNYSLGELRAIQDWYIRYQLNSVSGVAEVASIGGFIKQYQIDIDPNKLLAYNIALKDVINSVKSSNRDVGGKLLENNDIEYIIRGLGYIKDTNDIENIIVSYDKRGVPIYVKNIATVQIGGDIRRGLLDENGEGEVVGGIVVMRFGENAKEVIDKVKEKIKEISSGLPKGVVIETGYDRSYLIERSVENLKHTLFEEAIIVSLIVVLFLLHLRSSLIIIISIPIAVLISFIFMYYLKITSNIMSLGGIAIAIGVLVDSAIVMVENAYRHLSENSEKDRKEIIIESAKQVGKPIFFSLLIIILSFSPVFLLEGQEGRLFKPLALTKTFSMSGAALLSITLIPVLMTFLMKGNFRKESKNPISNFFNIIYNPILKTALRYRKITILIAFLSLISMYPLYKQIGSEFMPPLDEGSLLFMPVTLPNVTVTEAKRILQVQDKIIKSHPEVKYVLGKVGRADTSTDPAPVSMIETIILLKPKSEWRIGINKNDIISELDSMLQIPGVSNGWTQPIINRINMLATGVRTDLGVKIYGNDLGKLADLALKIEEILKPIKGATDLFAERTVSGKFLDIKINRNEVAKYGINVGDVQNIIETAIGGMNITSTVEGRQRFPVRVRYSREYRNNVNSLKRIFVKTPQGSIPLTQLADISFSNGPPMINSENSMLRSIVFLNVRNRDMGSFVKEAKQKLEENLELPSGYYISWSGQFENQERASKRLKVLIPSVLIIIFILLYFTFNSIIDSFIVILSVPFALIGGLILVYFMNYNFSVAVWVGFIALAGIAVETGVVMLHYLIDALETKLKLKNNIFIEDLQEAVIQGAVLRLRPKLMTTSVSLIGLIPIMYSSGTGSDVMKPIAAPMIGGVISSTILVLIVIPVLFYLTKEITLKTKGILINKINNNVLIEETENTFEKS